MEILDNLPPAIGLVLALLLVVWLVLALLVPFMIESIRSSNRRSLLELEELNAKIDRLVTLLEHRTLANGEPVQAARTAAPIAVDTDDFDDGDEFDDEEPDDEPPAPTRFERRRKEPTI